MRGLYAIIDVGSLDLRGLDPVRFAESVIAARPAAIQLRDKQGNARRTLDLLRAIAPAAKRAGVPFFANDRPDLALLAGCDGVHVGQEDLPPSLVRSIGPALRVGLSTHNRAQVEAAAAEPLDYLAIGPIFPTTTKDRPSPVVGLDGLAELVKAARAARPDLPTVGIGGITLKNAASVGATASMAAVIGGLFPAPDSASPWDDITARTRALHAAACGEEQA